MLYFVPLKATPNGGKSLVFSFFPHRSSTINSKYESLDYHLPSCLIVHLFAGFYHSNQGKLTCDQSLSQDKDHYREEHFPQSADP